MARLARVVVEGVPHHVTQRGNRRQPVFFSDDDYAAYKTLTNPARKNNCAESITLAFCWSHLRRRRSGLHADSLT